MNCQECDQIWNQLLDAESPARPAVAAEREQAARAHAENCPQCRAAGARYEILRHALRAWLSTARPEIVPEAALVERVLAKQQTGSGRGARRWRTALPLGAMAAAVACVIALLMVPLPWKLERVWSTSDRGRSTAPPGESAPHAANRPADSHVLSEALAEATAATWDLALTTSEPAARLGRQVLQSATGHDNQAGATASADEPAGSSYPGFNSLAAVLTSASQAPPGSTLLQEVEDGLSAGIRPLSSTARQAFGFLRMPSLEKSENTLIHQPASKGA